MPEMHFRIRWPDGNAETCYSPSLIVKDFLVVGESYPLADFLTHSRTMFAIANARVRAKYGFACGHAIRQLAQIEERATAFVGDPKARVLVEAFIDELVEPT
jgi:uncharacterized repeat protein (TIGR04042 family)